MIVLKRMWMKIGNLKKTRKRNISKSNSGNDKSSRRCY